MTGLDPQIIEELNRESVASKSPMRLCRHGETYNLTTDSFGSHYHKCPLCGDDWHTSCDEYDELQAWLNRRNEHE